MANVGKILIGASIAALLSGCVTAEVNEKCVATNSGFKADVQHASAMSHLANKANRALDNGEFETALELTQSVLEQPNTVSNVHAWALEIQGRAHYKLGRVPDAIAAFEQAIIVAGTDEAAEELNAYIADLKTTGTFVHETERFPKPLVRIVPIFPWNANASGHCEVVFDVDKNGSTYNVQTASCTNNVFARPTIASVEKWKYNPKLENGQPVGFSGVETKVTFKLADECGNIIPEPK